MAMPKNSRRVVIAGATGLVGHELLRGLLADKTVSEVHALARRKREFRHPKLTVHLVDFASLAPLPPVDEVYLALGTTIKVAGVVAEVQNKYLGKWDGLLPDSLLAKYFASEALDVPGAIATARALVPEEQEPPTV